MAKTAFKGTSVATVGELPKVGSKAKDFVLVRKDLSEVSLKHYQGKRKLLNIFPSMDTSVCAVALEHFFREGRAVPNAIILNISMDLPFAAVRFCQDKGLQEAEILSAFRSDFPDVYGVRLTEGPLKGLCARAALVLDERDIVHYTKLVDEITEEPDYKAALAALEG